MLWSYRISDHDLRPNIHCPKNNHDLCIETEPVTVLHTLYTIGPLFFKSCTLYSTVYSTVTVCMYLAQKPDIYRCICYKCDRLNFYVKIQIIFGTVWLPIMSIFVVLKGAFLGECST